MRKLLLLLGLLIALLPLSAMAQNEDAPTLTPGSLVTGTLNAENYVDAYLFTGSVGDLVSVSATTTDELPLVLLITGPEGGIVAQAGDPAAPTEAIVSNLELPASGTYTVTVLRGSGMTGTETGTYSLILTGRLTPPDDSGTVDATPDTTQATPAPATTDEPGATETTGVEPATFEVENVTLETGGISIGLGWSQAVDLNLEVRDPLAGALFFDNTNVPSGGSFSGDVNADCETARATNPTEAATWPAGTLPAGSYEILIYYINGCEINTPQEFNIIATLNNETPQIIRGTLNPGQQYLARVELETDGSWSLINGGVNAGLNVSQLSTQIAAAEALAGNTVTGVITNEQPAVAYTFQAEANTTVNFNLNRTSGSLDAFLLLLDQQGRELVSNDDSDNTTTNSAISHNVTQAGTYTIVATRFGQTIGGTEGGFQLIRAVTQTVAAAPTATAGAVTSANTPAPVPTLAPTASTLTQNLPQGTVEVTLNWQTLADLQLLVRDPTGVVIYDDTPPPTPGGLPTSTTGGILAEDGNVGCTGTAGLPAVSYAYWPQGRVAPRGVYEVDVWYQNNCNDNTPVTFNLTVEVDGQQIINQSQALVLDQHYMITFNLADGSAEAFEGGHFDMDSALNIPFFEELESAQPLTYGNSVSGSITNEDRFVVYSFQANAGDVVQISMERTGGTLDPVLYLLGEGGIQFGFNDDTPNQPPGGQRNTNSLLVTEPLRAAGTYYIIATHYGQQFGGTTGTYRLTILETP